MALKLLIFLTLLHLAVTQYNCNERGALRLLKQPAYDFSTKILDKASQNAGGHFVFAPFATWLQLNALAEGATGSTRRELWRYTRQHKNICFKNRLAKIIHKIDQKKEYTRKSVMVIDEFMAVKKKFIRDVKSYYGVDVLLKDFTFPDTSAWDVNEFIKRGTKGVIAEGVYSDDFDKTVMILSDNVLFRSAWLRPFNASYTEAQPFVGVNGLELGKVNMMSQVGHFNTADLPSINARVLEIPCYGKISMLVFLASRDVWIGDLFFDLQRMTLNSILNTLKAQGPKLVNLKLPRFRVNTTVDNLPELLADMGVKTIFYPRLAGLENISKFVFASVMAQVANIEVTEQGVRASATPENLAYESNSDILDFVVNRPFGYMLVDMNTQFIIFAGTYSEPDSEVF